MGIAGHPLMELKATAKIAAQNMLDRGATFEGLALLEEMKKLIPSPLECLRLCAMDERLATFDVDVYGLSFLSPAELAAQVLPRWLEREMRQALRG